MMEKTTRRLFVGGLFDGITKEDLENRFKRFGDISSVDVRARKDDTGNILKTFAYMDCLMTERQFKQCVATFNKTKWKGNEVQIQIAKESYLDRLKREREAASQVEEEVPPIVVPPETVTLVVKDATPGAAVEGKQDWVVGKYGTALPMVNIRTKDKKKVSFCLELLINFWEEVCGGRTKLMDKLSGKVIRVDPSKYVHGVKRLDRGKNAEKNDIPNAPVTQLTWELEAQDSEITKKRKGEFPNFFPKKKKVAAEQVSPRADKLGHRSSSESDSETREDKEHLGCSRIQYHSNTESESESSNDEQKSRKKTNLARSTPKSAKNIPGGCLTPDVSVIVPQKQGDSDLPHGLKKLSVASQMLGDIMASAKKASSNNTTPSEKTKKTKLSTDLLHSGFEGNNKSKKVESSSSDPKEDSESELQKSASHTTISQGDMSIKSKRSQKSIMHSQKGPSTTSEDEMRNKTQIKFNLNEKRKGLAAKSPLTKNSESGSDELLTHIGHEMLMKSSGQKKKRVRAKHVRTESEKILRDVKHIEFDIDVEDSDKETDILKQQSSLPLSSPNHPGRVTVTMADEYASGFCDSNSDNDEKRRKRRNDDHGFSSEEDLLDAVASGRVQKLERIAKFATQRYSHITVPNASVTNKGTARKVYNSDSSDSESNILPKTKITQQKKMILKVSNKKALESLTAAKVDRISPATKDEGKNRKQLKETKQSKDGVDRVQNATVPNQGRVIDPESIQSAAIPNQGRASEPESIQSAAVPNKGRTSDSESISTDNVSSSDDSGSVASEDIAAHAPIQQSRRSRSSYSDQKEYYKRSQMENVTKLTKKPKTPTEDSSEYSDEESDDKSQELQRDLKQLPVKKMEEKLTASKFLSKLEKECHLSTKTISEQDSDQKHAEANKKRLETVKQRSKYNLAQKSLLQQALSAVDSQPTKKIVFDSDSEDDYGLKVGDLTYQEVTERSSDDGSIQQKSLPVKQGNQDSDSGNKSSSASSEDDEEDEDKEQEKKAKLFEQSDASDEESDAERFRLRPQFEGKAGSKLMSLQTSVFGNDPRFKITEIFKDNEEEEENDQREESSDTKKQEAKTSISDTEVGDLTSEREQAMAILHGVIGKKFLTASKQGKKFKDINALTYDPTRQGHEKFEVKVDAKKLAEKKKKKQKKVVEPGEPIPEVSKERFFEVEGSLAEAFTKDPSEKPFSLLAMLGRTAEVEGKKLQDDGVGVPIEKAGTLSWGEEQSDSEDDHQMTVEDNSNVPTSTSLDLETVSPCTSNTFFFSEGDQRIKAGVAFFCRTKDLETIREKWIEQRPALVEAYRMKSKRIRSSGFQRGRGAVRGQGQSRGNMGRGRGRGHKR